MKFSVILAVRGFGDTEGSPLFCYTKAIHRLKRPLRIKQGSGQCCLIAELKRVAICNGLRCSQRTVPQKVTRRACVKEYLHVSNCTPRHRLLAVKDTAPELEVVPPPLVAASKVTDFTGSSRYRLPQCRHLLSDGAEV